jgi:hypothetical protein
MISLPLIIWIYRKTYEPDDWSQGLIAAMGILFLLLGAISVGIALLDLLIEILYAKNILSNNITRILLLMMMIIDVAIFISVLVLWGFMAKYSILYTILGFVLIGSSYALFISKGRYRIHIKA